MPEQTDYQEKKAFFDKVLTVYGRKSVLECLLDNSLQCHALHLADSNREAGIVLEIRQRAQALDLPIQVHSRQQLSRISKNGKQDQGVALDVICPAFSNIEDYLSASHSPAQRSLLALDGINNPQNLGMIIRSAAAGEIDGIILPKKGSAALGPLVIKASAGTLYRAPLLVCPNLPDALQRCREEGAAIYTLEASASRSLFERQRDGFCVYVLGNETEGVSQEARALSTGTLSIPMSNGVESLNVAVTASLIAYASYLER